MSAPDAPGPATSRSRHTVRERIDPRLTASLFANDRSATDALFELIDNAVDARVRDRALGLDLTIRPGTLTLTAVGGSGMSPRDIERDYVRWGASPKRAGDRIGRYGQSGKAARRATARCARRSTWTWSSISTRASSH